MGQFKTTHTAEIRVPQEGFTLDDLKAHMRKSKVPVDSRLKPAIVKTIVDPEQGGWEGDEIAFEAEWIE